MANLQTEVDSQLPWAGGREKLRVMVNEYEISLGINENVLVMAVPL